MTTKPPPNPTQHSVLTSDVINEVEQTFKAKATDGKVSQLDMIMLIRSMGMNPTDGDLDQLFDAMQIRDPERERQERIERDERERREKERREKEKAELEAAGDDKKAKREAQRKAASAAVKKRGKEEEKDQFVWIPPERRPVVDWTAFITHVEPFYKDNKIEEEEIMKAFKVFDREGRGWMTKDDLVKILTQKGEDILSPQEVAVLNETFLHSRVDFREFAQKMQGTWVEPKVEEPDVPMSTASSKRGGGAVSARRDDGSSSASVTGSVAGSTTPSSAK